MSAENDGTGASAEAVEGVRGRLVPRTVASIGASLVSAIVAGLVVLGLMQLLGGPVDRDAWFHDRLVRLIAAGEADLLGRSFPWLVASAYADLPADWSLGWHWFAALVEHGDRPLQTVIVLQSALAVLALGVSAAALRVRIAPGWALLLLATSPLWTWRLLMGRPTPLVVAVLLLLFVAVLRRRAIVAGGLATVALLVYQVPAPALLVGGCACLGLWVDQRRLPLREALAVLVGIAAGVLLHPGFWSVGPDGTRATFHVWGLMAGSLETAANGGLVELPGGDSIRLALPSELGTGSIGTLLGQLWPSLILTGYAGFLALRRREAASVATAAVAVLTLAATLRSVRFLEYWHPFAVLAAAVAISGPHSVRPARWHRQAVGLALIVGVLGSVWALGGLLRDHGPDAADEVVPAMTAVSAAASPGDVVFNARWDDFAALFHAAPELRYVSGMDPWYLPAHDPDDARAEARVVSGTLAPDELRGELQERFGARFVVLWSPPLSGGRTRRYADLERQLRDASWARVLHEDEAVVAFELR